MTVWCCLWTGLHGDLSSHLQLKVGEGTAKPKATVLGDSDLTLKTTQENNPTLIHLSPNQVRRKKKRLLLLLYSQKGQRLSKWPIQPDQTSPDLGSIFGLALLRDSKIRDSKVLGQRMPTPPKTQIGFTFGLESGTGTGCVSEWSCRFRDWRCLGYTHAPTKLVSLSCTCPLFKKCQLEGWKSGMVPQTKPLGGSENHFSLTQNLPMWANWKSIVSDHDLPNRPAKSMAQQHQNKKQA